MDAEHLAFKQERFDVVLCGPCLFSLNILTGRWWKCTACPQTRWEAGSADVGQG